MGRAWLMSAALAGLSGCTASQPGSGDPVSRSGLLRPSGGRVAECPPPSESALAPRSSPTVQAEALAGRRAADRLEAQLGGVEQAPLDERRMARIADRLGAYGHSRTRGVDCRVLASSARNAFSLPGPRIYVTRGLMNQLHHDDTLAAMIAHEMAHLFAGDSYKPSPVDIDAAIERELSADREALRILAAAGVDPSAYAELLSIISQTGDPHAVTTRSRALATVVE